MTVKQARIPKAANRQPRQSKRGAVLASNFWIPSTWPPVVWFVVSLLVVGLIALFAISKINGNSTSAISTDPGLKPVRDQLLLAFVLVATGIERLIELLFTWFEAAMLACGKSLGIGEQSDGWVEMEVRKLRELVCIAEDRLRPLSPDGPAFVAALDGLKQSSTQLTEAQARLRQSVDNPQYVALKKVISILVGLFLGIAVGINWKLTLFKALGFTVDSKADWILTGGLMGLGSAPAHAIIEALFGLGNVAAGFRTLISANSPLASPSVMKTNAVEPDKTRNSNAALDQTDHLVDSPDWVTANATATRGEVPASFDGGFDQFTVVGYDKTSTAFQKRLIEVAEGLEVEPLYLAAAISFETGGRFSPSVRNTQSGAVGLIQFMPVTAHKLGTSVQELAAMTAVAQLTYVRKYFEPYKGKLGSLTDTYMAILWPAAVGRGENFVLFRQGTSAYTQNRGLDIDRDGAVSAGEAASLVRKRIVRRHPTDVV